MKQQRVHTLLAGFGLVVGIVSLYKMGVFSELTSGLSGIVDDPTMTNANYGNRTGIVAAAEVGPNINLSNKMFFDAAGLSGASVVKIGPGRGSY